MHNPWIGPGTVLGSPEGRSVAYLGSNNLIELRYKYRADSVKEVSYMRLLQGKKGIPVLYYTNLEDPKATTYVAVTNRLYPIPETDNVQVLLGILRQTITLLRLLFNHGMYNGHLEYFTFTDGTQVHFIDNRLWGFITDTHPDNHTLIDNSGMLRNDITSMCRMVERIDKNRKIYPLLLSIYNYMETTRTIDDTFYETLLNDSRLG